MIRTAVARLVWSAVIVAGLAGSAGAHCQVPCGIYDDHARIHAMLEDAQTIEKAMAKIRQLAGQHDPLAFNQAARWITTKEQHASNIISVVSEYFLTQKIKDVAEGEQGRDAYLQQLGDHHAVLRAAMKCKQQVKASAAAGLTASIENLRQYYAK